MKLIKYQEWQRNDNNYVSFIVKPNILERLFYGIREYVEVYCIIFINYRKHFFPLPSSNKTNHNKLTIPRKRLEKAYYGRVLDDYELFINQEKPLK